MMLQKIIPLLFITSLTACEGCKDDPSPKTELEKLPPATQEGKYTFGCLVNGKAWVTETSIDVVVSYQNTIFQMSAHLNNKEINQIIDIILIEADLLVGTYTLTDDQKKYVEVYDFETNCSYKTDLQNIGILEITKIDAQNRIISGAFEFNVTQTTCPTLTATNGRFDVTYAN